jgi:CRP/FNR family transcriptional regulator, cyclic AMP receptor protein
LCCGSGRHSGHPRRPHCCRSSLWAIIARLPSTELADQTNGEARSRTSPSRVSLLEVEPDFGRFLIGEEFAEARRLSVSVLVVEDEHCAELETQLAQRGAFGALVLEGMVIRQLAIGDQLGMRLLGPGDLVSSSGDSLPMLVGESKCRALAGTRLALLGGEVIVAARRWPSLIAGLQLRSAQQLDRLATQLVICQLPRVDQRIQALMWLLAESWGRVTPGGTVLPLRLTHDALGALIGARRPTVTLALGDLIDRGAIVRLDGGWLLLEPFPEASPRSESFAKPALIDRGPSSWSEASESSGAADTAGTADGAGSYDELRHTFEVLRQQHARNVFRFRERMSEMERSRKRATESREVAARQRVRNRRSASP